MTKYSATHVPSEIIIKGTGINRNTFNSRLVMRDISYIQPFNGTRLFDVKDWNRKNSDYQLDISDIK